MAAEKLNLDITKGTSYGPVQISCTDALGAPVPLAGWKAFAEARKSVNGIVVLDFAPVIAADDAAGLVTFPALAYAATAALPAGSFGWDVILETPAGIRLEPFLAGVLTVTPINTQKA
jgi:hypothetical protein